MKEKIETLIHLGMCPDEAKEFCRSIYNEGADNTIYFIDQDNWRDDYETVPFESLIK